MASLNVPINFSTLGLIRDGTPFAFFQRRSRISLLAVPPRGLDPEELI